MSTLFGCVFKSEPGEFGSFLSGELVGGGGAGVGIGHLHQSGASAGEFGDDGGDVARVVSRQSSIGRLDGLPSCRPLRCIKDFQLGGMDRRDGSACKAAGVACGSNMFAGLAIFEDAAGRLSRSIRYWSLSNPLPLSRSFHQASPWRARSSSAARTAASMMAS